MHANAKTVVINQWKLINQLKTYFAKFSKDKTFEHALDKEFAHFLQRIQPSVYGSDLVRYFQKESKEISLKENKGEEVEPNGSIFLPSILKNGFKLTLGRLEPEAKKVVPLPKWKLQPMVSMQSIADRTSDILIGLLDAPNVNSAVGLVDDLCSHIKLHPETKHKAVKEGGIRILLRIRKIFQDDTSIQSSTNEALAILGYTDPVPGKGVRILSIDGGGTRGILVIEMLKKLEEFSGKPVHELFDIICGVSTGSIIASLIGYQQKTLDEVADIYKNISKQVFSQSTLKGTSSLVWSHSYYDTALWEQLLQGEFGDVTLLGSRRNLKCPKLCSVSAVVNQSSLSAYVFRNYNLPCRVQSQYMGGSEHLTWQAVRASAAAPTYFEEFKLGNMLHQDGGILVNNPTAVAIHEAKLLWPTTPLQCVISFGTGRTAPLPVDPNVNPTPVSNSSWKHKFMAILDSATDTEGVHTMLSDLLPGNTYFRFNPYLTEMLNMAEINPDKLEQLKRDAVMYLRRNEDKFQDAANALNVSKSTSQKAVDWLNYQKEIHNVRSLHF